MGIFSFIKSFGGKILGALGSVLKSPKTLFDTVSNFIGGYKKGGISGALQTGGRNLLGHIQRAYRGEAPQVSGETPPPRPPSTPKQLTTQKPGEPKVTRDPFQYPRHGSVATLNRKRTRAHLEKDTGQPGIFDTLRRFYNKTLARGGSLLPKIGGGRNIGEVITNTIRKNTAEKGREFAEDAPHLVGL